MAEQTPVSAQNAGKVKNYQWILVVAAFSAFLATFNETFLNVAFTPIMKNFSIDVSAVQWLATAYMLSAAVMVPVSAFLYRSIRTKRLYLFSVSLLIIGSAVGALAFNFPMLLAGRILQAIGTGVLIPVGMNITLAVAPKQKLGVYMGIMGAMTTLGPSSSIIVAGILLNSFSWHSLLWVFGAMSLACFLLGAAVMKDIETLTHPRLDILSVILIGLALIGLLYGISTSFSGNLSLALISIAAGLIILILFLLRQRILAEPLIELTPLKIKAFSISVVINMFALMLVFSMNIILPLFMQNGLEMSAFVASMVLFPAILLACVVSPIAGRVYDRFGGKILIPLGFLLAAVFIAGLGLSQSAGSPIVLAVLYIPVVCGVSLIIGPVQTFALSHLTPEQNPHGVTILSTGFQIAGCIGSSLFSGIFGICARPAEGFTSVCILAAAVAALGFILSAYVTRSSKAPAAAPSAGLANDLTSIIETRAYRITSQDSVLTAVQCMTEHKVSGLPIVDEQERVVGFIADGDISYLFHKDSNRAGFASMYPMWRDVNALEQKLAQLDKINVMEVATTKPVCVDVQADMEELFNAFSDKRIKKVPITDRNRLVGIVSRSDLLRHLFEQTSALSHS